MNYSLQRIKEHLEINIGDIGFKMLESSLSKLKISENPSTDEIETLLSDLKKKLVNFYGESRSNDILVMLHHELILEQRSYESELHEKLNYFFSTKGVPQESDISEIEKYLRSKGHKIEGIIINDTLKKLSKDRICSALTENIVTREVRSFLNRTPSYLNNDVEQFIKHLQIKELRVNEGSIMEAIEKERLLRKFNDTNLEESQNEKLCRQFFERVNPGDRTNYGYLVSDEGVGKLARNIADKENNGRT